MQFLQGVGHPFLGRVFTHKRLLGIPVGILPQQIHVGRILHLPIDVRRRQKVPIYSGPAGSEDVERSAWLKHSEAALTRMEMGRLSLPA